MTGTGTPTTSGTGRRAASTTRPSTRRAETAPRMGSQRPSRWMATAKGVGGQGTTGSRPTDPRPTASLPAIPPSPRTARRAGP